MFKSNKRFNYQGGKFDKGYLATAQPNITKNVGFLKDETPSKCVYDTM